MAKKKKETTGLLMAITPVTVREEKKKGGLLESNRQGYQEGEEVEVVGIPQEEREAFTLEDGKAIDSEGREASLDDIASGRLDIGRFFDRELAPRQLSEELQEALNTAEEKSDPSIGLFGLIPIEIDDKELSIYHEGLFYSPGVDRASTDEMVKEMKSGRVRFLNYDMLKRVSDQYESWKENYRDRAMEESTGVIGAHKLQEQERKGNKGGGLLSSDRQRYQEGTNDGPVPRPASDYQGPRDYDPIEFEDLDALPRGATGDIIAEQRRLRESLLMSLDNLMDTEARMIMDNPGYTEEVRGLLRPFTGSISPFERRINEVYTNYDNAFSRENVDNPYPSRETMQEEIHRRVEILRRLQEEASEREPKQEGGLPEPIPQEAMPMPMDTPMAMEDSMVPDEQMEDNYLDFVISQALDDEEEVYLMDKLEADPQLSIIFDKLIGTATEFSGAGPVDGPGSEVSDSIPARLSDGEFVLTAKATDELGPDNVQAMMVDAEARSDERQLAQTGGVIRPDLEKKSDQLGRPVDDEIRKGMLGTNPRLQQLG